MKSPHPNRNHCSGDLSARIDLLELSDLADSGRLRRLAGTLTSIAAISQREGVDAYLVGGAVRDLLLRRRSSGSRETEAVWSPGDVEDIRDIDIVVEGDAARVARTFAESTGRRCQVSREFGTASIMLQDGLRVDFASARRETYANPGALPKVQAASLADDLRRRDFTINALAASLKALPQLDVIDVCAGIRDLQQGVIRVLHERSFQDDPTRIFRAVRLEQRLHFVIEPQTLRLARIAVQAGGLQSVSGDRRRKEFVLLCDEPAVLPGALHRLEEIGVLSALVPGLRFDERASRLLEDLRDVAAWMSQLPSPRAPRFWLVVLMVLCSGLTDSEKRLLAERFAIDGDDRSVLIRAGSRIDRVLDTLDRSHVDLPAHQVSATLEPLSIEELLYLAARGGTEVETWVQREVAEFRPLQLTIGGSDLMRQGYPSGPGLGRVLAATREARLDGRISAANELEYAVAILTRNSGVES